MTNEEDPESPGQIKVTTFENGIPTTTIKEPTPALGKICPRCKKRPRKENRRWCHKCTTEYYRAYREKHSDEMKGYRKKWRKENWGSELTSVRKRRKRRKKLIGLQ